MNTNTKQFLKLIEKVTAAGKETNLNSIARGFISEGFSLESPIIIEYSKKHFKPLDFESYFIKENNINKLYFITAVKENENINYYSFVYSCKSIKEAKFLDFCFYAYKSNAELRKNTIYTILIYQNKKYIESMQQKKENRAANKEINIKERFLFVKDFYNDYGNDESMKQRYKYIQKDFINNCLCYNMLLSMKYNFNFSNRTAYWNGVKNFEIDKSGYILTYKRDDLKRRAAALKEKRARDNFEKYQHEFYLKALKDDKSSIEAQLLTAQKEYAPELKNDCLFISDKIIGHFVKFDIIKNYSVFDRFDFSLNDTLYKKLYNQAKKLYNTFTNSNDFQKESCFISSNSLHGFYFPNNEKIVCIAFLDKKPYILYKPSENKK